MAQSPDRFEVLFGSFLELIGGWCFIREPRQISREAERLSGSVGLRALQVSDGLALERVEVCTDYFTNSPGTGERTIDRRL